MDFILRSRIGRLALFSIVQGCSLGTRWKGEEAVERTTEIPLTCVPWISQKQHQKESQCILPYYFALKHRQECAQHTLNRKFQKLEAPQESLCK